MARDGRSFSEAKQKIDEGLAVCGEAPQLIKAQQEIIEVLANHTREANPLTTCPCLYKPHEYAFPFVNHKNMSVPGKPGL